MQCFRYSHYLDGGKEYFFFVFYVAVFVMLVEINMRIICLFFVPTETKSFYSTFWVMHVNDLFFLLGNKTMNVCGL